jgi:hypothetical protein
MRSTPPSSAAIDRNAISCTRTDSRDLAACVAASRPAREQSRLRDFRRPQRDIHALDTRDDLRQHGHVTVAGRNHLTIEHIYDSREGVRHCDRRNVIAARRGCTSASLVDQCQSAVSVSPADQRQRTAIAVPRRSAPEAASVSAPRISARGRRARRS